MLHYIYTLADPRTGCVRYVGQTVNPRTRLRGHKRRRGQAPVSRWVQELVAAGLQPTLSVVDCVIDSRVATVVEQEWMRVGVVFGWDLLNAHLSGDRYYSLAARAKISAKNRGKVSWCKGQRLSPETRAKISAARRRQAPPMAGRRHTEATRAQMAATARRSSADGKAFSAEHRAKISAAKMGHAVSPEVRAKISTTLRQRTV